MRYPVVKPYISNPYGQQGASYFHYGVDFADAIGTPLIACLDFSLYQAPYWSDRGGWSVAVRFSDGVIAWYQHMKAKSHLITGGSESELIGYMGNTGSATTGPHLHFETRRATGETFDPIPWIRDGIAAGGGATPFPPTPDPTPKPKPILEAPNMDEVTLVMRGEGTTEWALVGASIPRGRATTRNQLTANAWAAMYGNARIVQTSEEYAKILAEAEALNTLWLNQQKAINGTA